MKKPIIALFAALTIVITAAAAFVVSRVAEAAQQPPAAAASTRTYIHCLNKAGDRYVTRYRPGKCVHYGRGGINAGGVFLRRIRWFAWDRPSVRGRAVECGFHLPCAEIPARIRAYRRRRACGRVVFTRLQATTRYGTAVVRLARCPREAR